MRRLQNASSVGTIWHHSSSIKPLILEFLKASSYDQTVLLVEYDATSPVNALETVVYGDADLLPSGMTGAEFKGIMARRRQRD